MGLLGKDHELGFGAVLLWQWHTALLAQRVARCWDESSEQRREEQNHNTVSQTTEIILLALALISKLLSASMGLQWVFKQMFNSSPGLGTIENR